MPNERPIEPENPVSGLWTALVIGILVAAFGGYITTLDEAEVYGLILTSGGGLVSFIASIGLGVFYGVTAANRT